MSKNWGRTPVTNADKRLTSHLSYIVETPDGPMRRIDRRPLGKTEMFVDAAGNVCHVTMCGDGDSRKADTEQRNRSAQHRKGCIEYAKCPIRHGTQMHAQRDFAKMPKELAAQCQSDPRPYERLNFNGEPAKRGEPGDLYARESCPHIEWLIKYRREEAAKQAALLNPHAIEVAAAKKRAEELQAAQIELVKEQIAERRTRRSKKDPGE